MTLAAVAGLAVLRVAVFGWESPTADHARYVYSGLSLLDGRGFVGERGQAFLVRAPAYPLLVGAGFAGAGWPGAHLVASGLSLFGLLIAVAYGASVAGPLAGAFTALTLVCAPMLWSELPSLGIDLPHASVFVVAVMCLWRPTVARWVAGGITLGVAVLLKETVVPAVALLPLAWLPFWSEISWARWLQLSLVFAAALAATAGWWWIYVLQETGTIFPLNSLAAIVLDETPGASDSGLSVALAVATGSLWVVVTWIRRTDVRVRLLAAAAASIAPAAVISIAMDQPARNLMPLVVLSSVVIGVGLALASARLLPGSPRRGWATMAVAACVASSAAAVAGQSEVPRPMLDTLPQQALASIEKRLDGGSTLVSTFRYRSVLGVELFKSDVAVRLLPVQAMSDAPLLGQLLWIGLRDGTPFVIERAAWSRVLGSGTVHVAAFGSPHPLTPATLLKVLRSDLGADGGFRLLEHLGDARTITVFAVQPELVARGTELLPLTAEPAALLRWMDGAASSGRDATTEVLGATPWVDAEAPGLRKLAQRLGPTACFHPRRLSGWRALEIRVRDGTTTCHEIPVDSS